MPLYYPFLHLPSVIAPFPVPPRSQSPSLPLSLFLPLAVALALTPTLTPPLVHPLPSFLSLSPQMAPPLPQSLVLPCRKEACSPVKSPRSHGLRLRSQRDSRLSAIRPVSISQRPSASLSSTFPSPSPLSWLTPPCPWLCA